jgi:Killing trait
MADPTLMNGPITDAVTQAGLAALALAPGHALATDFQVSTHATGLAMQNAVANQRSIASMSGVTATQAAARILTLAPSVSARATHATLAGQALASELLSLSAALRARRRDSASSAPEPKPLARSPGPVAPAATADAVPSPNADALAPTPDGEPRMSDHEALDALRRSVEELNKLLEGLSKQMASGPPPDIWKQLCEALDGVRRAIRVLEDRGRPGICPPLQPPPVPVGATPGVWNQQSVYIHSDRSRIVGAS